MSISSFDFEKPIGELETNLAKFSEFVTSKDIDVGTSLATLKALVPDIERKIYQCLTPWDKIQLTRHPLRPYPQDYINDVFTDFLELHGDRHYADDQTIYGGFAKLDTQDVMVIATRKGRNLKQNMLYNFGCAMPEGFRKALRLMKLADKARCPIITFIDTPGAYPGIGSEQRNVSEAIAMNLREMFRFSVPIICVITGEGGSGGALSIAVGNKVLMMEYAYYSVITPEGCAAIIWRSIEAIPKAASALKLTADDLFKLHVIDDIIPEPAGGAHRDPEQAARLLKDHLRSNLGILLGLSPADLKQHRYERFRNIGQFIDSVNQ